MFISIENNVIILIFLIITVEFVKLRSFEEFQKYQKSNRNERILYENNLIKEFEENKLNSISGYCRVCEKNTKFKLNINKKKKINFRGSLVCEHCKLGNRKRFMLSFLKDFTKNSDSNLRVFMYEQITKFFRLAQKINSIDLTGSEFLGYEKNPGQIIKNIRNEDALNLSFKDNSFDVIVSNDVFEHIPNINKSLSEAQRVLKNSGSLLISIPFYQNKLKTIRRASIKEGNIENILPPMYHSNPISKKDDSLVFYDFGWDFLDFLKSAGFSEQYLLGYYDIFHGHIGNGLQFIFVAKK